MRVFIGYDSREDIAYRVAKASILKYNSSLEVLPIIRKDLIEEGIYSVEDSLGSTEFTITRFLTPYLSNYTGISLFMDCDVLVQTDLEDILVECDLSLPVNCVKHEYTPKTDLKMDNRTQYVYPRKNWSSVMVFNCEHKLIRKNLTVESVNSSTPKYLHRMGWAEENIGELHHTWNYLVGYYSDIEKPNILHYTDGGPWFENYKNCEFSENWNSELKNV